MKILVTGNRGFIGKNLVQRLQDRHQLTYCEWGDPLPTIEGLDWVVHLGANSSTVERNVDLIMTQNYDFSCWVLEQCVQHGVNLQYSSSASIYGLTRDCVEDGPVDPRSPYAWSKYLFDRHVSKIIQKDKPKIRIQGFRYFNVYGPGEDHKKDQASPFYKFDKQARETGIVRLFYGSNHYLRDFVPVERVVEVHEKFFDVNESGIWNVGTGKARSFQSVADEIVIKYNAGFEYVDMPESIRVQYQIYTCANIEKLKRSLGE